MQDYSLPRKRGLGDWRIYHLVVTMYMAREGSECERIRDAMGKVPTGKGLLHDM